jgi:hypothetical protein
MTLESSTFMDINLESYLELELEHSFRRFPRLLMYEYAIKKSIAGKHSNFIYYLHEYCYGRFFSYLLKKEGFLGKTIGFQHGPASKRKMLYYLSTNEVGVWNCLLNCPLPDTVLAEDESSRNIYIEANYKNVKVMSEIFRLRYLKNIKRELSIEKTILMAAGLHDGQLLLENKIAEVKDNQTIQYLFKLHPRAANDYIIKEIERLSLPNLAICDKHISYYLSFVHKVVSTYSSVGYEADLLGIEVELISLSGQINESPLYKL